MFYRAIIDGDIVDITPSLSVDEALEDDVIRTASIEVTDTPSVKTNDIVTLTQVNLDTSTYVDFFKGQVNSIEAVGFPNRVTFLAAGVMAKLRRVRTSDFNLTGMTDGEVVENILTFCGISFVSSRIADAGYVFGQKEPVYWKKNQSGLDLLREVDRVFGSATIEVLDGQVIRFFYDRVPSSSDIVKTYTRATSTFFYSTERRRGDLDAIQNSWEVTGVSYKCGTDDECTCTPYANARATHAKLGSGKYTSTQTFSSEIIQSVDLIEDIANRQLRWFNREPDYIFIETENDPFLAVGMTIGITDLTYGISAGSPRPYLIVNINRSGDFMRITGLGGIAGATGTMDSGIEQVCNEDIGSFPDSPGFGGFPTPEFPSFPTFDMPSFEEPCTIQPELCALPQPPEPPEVLEFSDPEELASECVDLLIDPLLAQWEEPSSGVATWTMNPGSLTVRQLVTASSANRIFNPGMTVNMNKTWVMKVSFMLKQSRASIGVGITQDEPDNDFEGMMASTLIGEILPKTVAAFGTTAGENVMIAINGTYSIELAWDITTKTLTMTGSGNRISVVKPTADALWLSPAHPFIWVNLASGGDTGADAAIITRCQLCIEPDPTGGAGCQIVGITETGWNAYSGIWDFSSDYIELATIAPGLAYHNLWDLDEKSWTLAGTLRLGGDTSKATIGVRQNPETYLDETGGWWFSIGAAPHAPAKLEVGGPISSTETIESYGWLVGFDIKFRIVFLYAGGTGAFTVTITQGSKTVTLSYTEADPVLGHPYVVTVSSNYEEGDALAYLVRITEMYLDLADGCVPRIPDPGETGCDDLVSFGNILGWDENGGTVDPIADGLAVHGQAWSYFDTYELDYTQNWLAMFTINVATAGHDHDVEIGFIHPEFDSSSTFALNLYFENPSAPDIIAYNYVGTNYETLEGISFSTNENITITMYWDAATLVLTTNILDGGDGRYLLVETQGDEFQFPMAEPIVPYVLHSGHTIDEGVVVSNFQICSTGLNFLSSGWADQWDLVDNDVFGPDNMGSTTFDFDINTMEIVIDPIGSNPYTGWGRAPSLRTGISVGGTNWSFTLEGELDDINEVGFQLIDNAGGVVFWDKITAIMSDLTSLGGPDYFATDIDDIEYPEHSLNDMGTFRFIFTKDTNDATVSMWVDGSEVHNTTLSCNFDSVNSGQDWELQMYFYCQHTRGGTALVTRCDAVMVI